jgi:CBS domain-containing protein
MIMKVKKLLGKNGHGVNTISPDAPVSDALKLMSKKEINALVVSENGKMVGIVSEQDYERKIILKRKNPRETVVREIMTADVIHTSPDKKLGKCLSLMMKKRIHQLPVLEKERLVGMVTIEDIRWSWLPSKKSKEKYNCRL